MATAPNDKSAQLANFIALGISMLALLLATVNAYKHAQNSRVVRVERLEIVDRSGQVRAMISTREGQPTLAVPDNGQGARLELASIDGPTRLVLDITPQPGVQVYELAPRTVGE